MDENMKMDENLVAENNDTELEVPEVDNTSEETNEASNGKLGLAIMGLGALAIGGGTVALVKKIKNRKKAKEENPQEEEKKPKGKKIRAKRGRKLTPHEILTGHLDEVREAPEEENEEE